MRYVCEFAGATDTLLIRDLADDCDLEEILTTGIDILGPLIRCYALEEFEDLPSLGLVTRDVFTRAANA